MAGALLTAYNRKTGDFANKTQNTYLIAKSVFCEKFSSAKLRLASKISLRFGRPAPSASKYSANSRLLKIANEISEQMFTKFTPTPPPVFSVYTSVKGSFAALGSRRPTLRVAFAHQGRP